MEVTIGCGFADVGIVDENSVPIVSFSKVPVIGQSAKCAKTSRGKFGAAFRANPGQDFYTAN
jgi:hypothetical protein